MSSMDAGSTHGGAPLLPLTGNSMEAVEEKPAAATEKNGLTPGMRTTSQRPKFPLLSRLFSFSLRSRVARSSKNPSAKKIEEVSKYIFSSKGSKKNALSPSENQGALKLRAVVQNLSKKAQATCETKRSEILKYKEKLQKEIANARETLGESITEQEKNFLASLEEHIEKLEKFDQVFHEYREAIRLGISYPEENLEKLKNDCDDAYRKVCTLHKDLPPGAFSRDSGGSVFTSRTSSTLLYLHRKLGSHNPEIGSIPNQDDREHARAFLSHVLKTPSLQERFLQTASMQAVGTPMYDCGRVIQLASKEASIAHLKDKVAALQTSYETGRAPSKEERLSPEEAALLDECLSAKEAVDSMSSAFPDHPSIQAIKGHLEVFSVSFPTDAPQDDWEGASVFFYDLKASKEYETPPTKSSVKRFFQTAYVKIASWVYRKATGGAQGHAGVFIPAKEGESKESIRISHVTSEHFLQDAALHTHPGVRSHVSPYKAHPENLLDPKIREEVLTHFSEEELQSLWQQASKSVHEEYRRGRRAENSMGRQVRSILWGHKKSASKAKDYTKWTKIPPRSERGTMICSEFATIALIVTANKFNELLVSKLAEKTPPVTLKNEGRPLAKFPIDPREKLSHMHPPRLLDLCLQAGILEAIPPSKKSKHFFKLRSS